MVFLFPLIWEHEFTGSLGIHKTWKSVVLLTGLSIFIQVNEAQLLPVGLRLQSQMSPSMAFATDTGRAAVAVLRICLGWCGEYVTQSQ